MRKWMRKIGALAVSLALLLAMAGCSVDMEGAGGGEPARALPRTEASQPADTASSREALPDEPPGSGPSAAAADEETASGGELPDEGGLPEDGGTAIDEDGTYNSAEDVSLYLYTFGHLPENYITKKKARDLGWTGGPVEKVAPGCAIGGDAFGNREGVLPEGKYHECDIDTIGKNGRGAKRLVYSEDGRIYYTEDHYETFILLYGEE